MINKIREIIDIEALIWTVGLAIIVIGNPESDTHFTLFWPQWFFDIESPGRGLGHSIGYLFRGDIHSSLDSHLLGIPAVAILSHRIVTLQIRKIRITKMNTEVNNG